MTRAGRIPREVAGSTRPVAADAHRQLGLETKPQSFRRHKFWRSQAAQGRKSALFDGTKRLFNGDYWPRAAARRARTDGAVGDPTPDPDHPMLRGMITINVASPISASRSAPSSIFARMPTSRTRPCAFSASSMTAGPTLKPAIRARQSDAPRRPSALPSAVLRSPTGNRRRSQGELPSTLTYAAPRIYPGQICDSLRIASQSPYYTDNIRPQRRIYGHIRRDVFCSCFAI